MYKVFLLLVAISCQIGSRENLYVQIDPQTKMSKYRQWEREKEREREIIVGLYIFFVLIPS